MAAVRDRWRRLVAAVLGTAAALTAGVVQPAGTAPAERVTQQWAGPEGALRRSVEAYGAHPRQRVTVHWQPRLALRGGLVILHGGYWSYDTDWEAWARAFARRGYAVFDAGYRLSPGVRWPAQRDDVVAALRWVRRNAAAYAVDPARVGVLGSSAGGHLAVAAATYGAGASRTAGVVALSPVASPYRAWLDGGTPGATAAEQRLRTSAERLAGCVPDGTPAVSADPDCRRAWWSLDPRSGASGRDDAPMLLLHSADDFVPAYHSEAVAAAERARGMPAEDVRVRVVPGGAHGMRLLTEPGVAGEVEGWLRRRIG
ncbi:alpha/beta hydrolase [Streptomyces sp. WMMC500]|uniref:alpha/beta hydrolase fold domain-containing protein n=1 Tax=Streptomyces sp. WMMC500 TaxID=3015154 RepID=UPI00248B780E|nr:alpha/beta hydrolase [Streptomyces sp. WMMC500]WBB58955.1 alpha/beta hydrolase [Streptomyces sp. WMMC500]